MIVCVSIPSYDGKPCAQLVDSLLAEQLVAGRQGVHLLVQWKIGVALIGLARSQLAQDFLDIPQADCMVFVDSDISWTRGDLTKLALSEHDVIGATYRTKSDPEYYHVHGFKERVGDIYKVGGLPGGFIKISRKAFEAIDAPTFRAKNGKTYRDYFPNGIIDGVMFGEDYGFCRLWQRAGGTVWLDPSIILKHHDGGRAYTGDPKAWLERE